MSIVLPSFKRMKQSNIRMYDTKMEQVEPDILVDVSSVFQNPLGRAVIRGQPVNKSGFSVNIKLIILQRQFNKIVSL